MRSFGAAVLGILLLAVCPTFGESRIALVIGNAHYTHVAPLPNPANDAALVAAALKKAGFTKVIVGIDLDYVGMRAALQNFSHEAAGADIAFVYFAGHGIEIEKNNYLIPVDATLARDSDVNFEAIPLSIVQDALAETKTLNVVILDACRNNPFATKMRSGVRAIGRGLARIEPTANNSLVVYAAKDGTTAEDGDGVNSPFAVALATRIPQPGLEIGFIFRAARDDVLRATKNRQEPMTYGALGGEPIYLTAPGANIQARVPPPLTVPQHVATVNPPPRIQTGQNLSYYESLTQSIRIVESSTHTVANMGRDTAVRARILANKIAGTNDAPRVRQGCSYTGQTLDGTDLKEGYGVLFCADKTVTLGRWRSGHLTNGTHTRQDECTEAGSFEDDTLHIGEVTCPHGPYKKAVGSFSGGKLQGIGTRYDDDGSVWIGNWTGGALNGIAIRQNAEGKTVEGGEYRAGKQTIAAAQ